VQKKTEKIEVEEKHETQGAWILSVGYSQNHSCHPRLQKSASCGSGHELENILDKVPGESYLGDTIKRKHGVVLTPDGLNRCPHHGSNRHAVCGRRIQRRSISIQIRSALACGENTRRPMAQEIDSDRISTGLPVEGLAVLGPNLVVGRCRCGGARVGEDHCQTWWWPSRSKPSRLQPLWADPLDPAPPSSLRRRRASQP
jgi:hypothetical protein